jgi:hypothetical protein
MGGGLTGVGSGVKHLDPEIAVIEAIRRNFGARQWGARLLP